jgi:ligand-binding SRPBCC domain-containing protein
MASGVYTLKREQFISRPLAEVFDFFAQPENLKNITPGWLHFRLLTPIPTGLEAGTQIRYALRWGWAPIRWTTKIQQWDPPNGFVDVQAKGPYRLWEHTHRFRAALGGTLIEDVVRYQLPFGFLGRFIHALRVRADLQGIFAYRAERIRELLSPLVENS